MIKNLMSKKEDCGRAKTIIQINISFILNFTRLAEI